MKILFSGCSLMYGSGVGGVESTDNWCNIFSHNVFGDNVTIKNISQGGKSNERIFTDTLSELNKDTYDYVFVGFTGLHRYWSWLGLETYDVTFRVTPDYGTNENWKDIELNDFHWPKKKLKSIAEGILLTNHAHYAIKDICTYVNTLLHYGTNIKFINSALPIDQDYFKRLTEFKPNDLTPYTQSLLNVENRDDDEIYELYNMMHDQYESCGGIQQEHWLNLYDSFYSQRTDLGTDNIHPGINSNKEFADNISKAF